MSKDEELKRLGAQRDLFFTLLINVYTQMALIKDEDLPDVDMDIWKKIVDHPSIQKRLEDAKNKKS